MMSKKVRWSALLCSAVLMLSACSSGQGVRAVNNKHVSSYANPKGRIADSNSAVGRLSAYQQSWKGTAYRLGGTSRKGVDCSGFTQITFRDLFGIKLPRMTIDQAKAGRKIPKSQLQAGDLVFFNTGRGPNGKHVGIYIKNGQFMHASTKKGVIYSDLNSPYWSKTFWQARRL